MDLSIFPIEWCLHSLLAKNSFVCALKKKKISNLHLFQISCHSSVKNHFILELRNLLRHEVVILGTTCINLAHVKQEALTSNLLTCEMPFSLVGACIIHVSPVLSILTHDTSDHRPPEKVLGSNYICPSTQPYKESYNWYVYIGAHIIFLRD
jgi:uncharacterized CHY-type Zn-finger protein